MIREGDLVRIRNSCLNRLRRQYHGFGIDKRVFKVQHLYIHKSFLFAKLDKNILIHKNKAIHPIQLHDINVRWLVFYRRFIVPPSKSYYGEMYGYDDSYLKKMLKSLKLG